MTLRLTEEQDLALTLLAQAEGVSKQEATVRAILDAAVSTTARGASPCFSATARVRYALMWSAS